MNLNRKSLFVMSGIPIVILLLVIIQPDIFIIMMVLVLAVAIMAFLLSIIHWGILDKSQNLGISADKYWLERDDDDSYTHSSS